jgi:hypothetical protein
MVSITSITEEEEEEEGKKERKKREHKLLTNLLKVAVFWNVTSSTLPEAYQHSRRICYLQYQCM